MKQVEQEDGGGDGGSIDGGGRELSRTRWMDGSGGRRDR